MRIRVQCLVALAWLCLFFMPQSADAQSAIAGQVKDASGAVLPGVSVEASSPVLIEKIRTVVTDGQGLYTIVDLRPGSYSIKFTLSGFSTVVREGVDLASNFTATVDAELKVGALEESVIVAGQAPTVDVRGSSATQVISRELVDAVPTAHDFRGLGATVPGVRPSIQNVGGTRALNPQILTVHGSDSRDTATVVDGLIMNSMMGDDNIHLYHNDALVQEINYQTSAIPAEYSKGGVIINIAPRDGGNKFHGQWYGNYASSSWQANNLTPELKAKGLQSQNRNGGLYDIDPWIGGPLLKDRLWFIVSYRDVYVKEIVANTFYPDGSPGFQQSHTRNASVRLTFQATANNKISIHADKQFKRLPRPALSPRLSGGDRQMDVNARQQVAVRDRVGHEPRDVFQYLSARRRGAERLGGVVCKGVAFRLGPEYPHDRGHEHHRRLSRERRLFTFDVVRHRLAQREGRRAVAVRHVQTYR